MYKAILKKNRLYVFWGIVMSIISSAIYVFAGYSLSFLLQNYSENVEINELLINGTTVFLIWGVALLVMYVYNVLQIRIVCRMKTDLREMMANKIVSMDCGEFLQKDTGNYVSWMTNDVEQINKDVFLNLFGMIDAIGKTVFSLIALFYLGITIGLSAILLFMLMAVIPQLAAKGIDKKTGEMSKENENATEKYKENIGGFLLFYLSNRQQYFVNKMIEISNKQEEVIFQKEKKSVFATIISAGISLVSQIVMILVTVCMASIGMTPVGAVLSVGNLGQTFFSNVGSLVGMVIKKKSIKMLWEKYEIKKDDVYKENMDHGVECIKLDHVNFSYDGKQVLKDFSYEIKKGKKYALIGESGVGKSTLGKLISGLLNGYEGSIRYDDLEISKINRKSLFRQITYVDQNVFIFGESVRFNVTLGEDFSDDEVWSALKKCNLYEFVESLDGKLDYRLEENGKNLSGGQRQRLALARAYIRKVSFIVLDEGTSSLDEKNAIEIEKTLLSESDIGLILISHHLSEESKEKIDAIIKMGTTSTIIAQ